MQSERKEGIFERNIDPAPLQDNKTIAGRNLGAMRNTKK